MKIYKNKESSLMLETVISERSDGSKETRPSILLTIGDQSHNVGDALALMEQLAKFSSKLRQVAPTPEYKPYTFMNVILPTTEKAEHNSEWNPGPV